MKILLLGEYSNVHNTLAQGLRALGHEVCVASNGDFWKDYPRDIDLKRDMTRMGTLSFFWRLLKALPKMRGYDVVQLINPIFLELKAEHLFSIYRYLRKHNKKVFLGAYGMDYYWVHVNDTIKPLRYSDFNINDALRHDEAAEIERRDWVGTAKQQLNEYIAKDCDGIISGLYEYWATYDAVPELRNKHKFIPFPIKADLPSIKGGVGGGSLGIFIGISKSRSAYKGTDIMLAAAERLKANYPDRVELKVAEGVPFNEYQKMMDSSDCILDQLYSYTPAMNALLAMSKGIIVVGGGEEENYEILTPDGIPVKDGGEQELRPIVNVLPVIDKKNGTIDYDSSVNNCYKALEQLVLHPERIPLMKQQSIEYIRRHHDYIKVARQYEILYKLTN